MIAAQKRRARRNVKRDGRQVRHKRGALCRGVPICCAEIDREELKILRESFRASDPTALALSALGWIIADDHRASRFLSLTGLTPDELRAGLTDPAIHCAVLDFLAAHEPDLIAAADALAVPPTALITARHALGGGEPT